MGGKLVRDLCCCRSNISGWNECLCRECVLLCVLWSLKYRSLKKIVLEVLIPIITPLNWWIHKHMDLFNPESILLWLLTGISVFFLFFPAPVIPADQRVPGPSGWVSALRVCWGRRLHQRFECAGHTHRGGLWDYESCVCDSGVHSCVLLPRQRTVPSALCCISQKPLLQWRHVCGHTAWLQVSWKWKSRTEPEGKVNGGKPLSPSVYQSIPHFSGQQSCIHFSLSGQKTHW